MHYYQLALKYDPSDAETLIEYANILESHSEQDSLTAYTKALKIMQAQGTPVSPELYNNIGVLKIRLDLL